MDEVKRVVRRLWDRAAPEFDQRPSHGLLNNAQRGAWRRLIAVLAGPRPLDALDLGCGTGFLSLLLAERGHRVTGIDMARQMLARARLKADAMGLSVNFIEADIEELDLPEASFDLIIERHVIWTLPRPGVALDKWRRLLRPGGRLALIEGEWKTMEPPVDDYERIRERLPLYGGAPEVKISALVRERGFREVAAKPLMAPALWTETPKQSRYLVVACR